MTIKDKFIGFEPEEELVEQFTLTQDGLIFNQRNLKNVDGYSFSAVSSTHVYILQTKADPSSTAPGIVLVQKISTADPKVENTVPSFVKNDLDSPETISGAKTDQASDQGDPGKKMPKDIQAGLDEFKKQLKKSEDRGDLLAQYLLVESYYTDFEIILENWLFQVKSGVTMHKDAVQNAVDIVQSKRIDFQGMDKEPYVAGILMSMAMVFFIEFAAAKAAVLMGSLLMRCLARMGPEGVLKKMAPRAFKAYSTRKSRLTRLERQRSRAPRHLQNVRNISDLTHAQFNKYVTYIQNLEQRIRRQVADVEAAEEKIEKELIRKYIKNKEIELGNTTKSVAKLAKEATPSSKSKSKMPIAHAEAIPLDVVFKEMIQFQFDKELFEAEQYLAKFRRLKGTLDTLASDEIAEALEWIFLNFPEFYKMEDDIEKWSKLFDEETHGGYGAVKAKITHDYEYKIWALLFGPDILVYQIIQGPNLTFEFWKSVTKKEFDAFQGPKRFWRREDEKSQMFLKYIRERFYDKQTDLETIAEDLAIKNILIKNEIEMAINASDKAQSANARQTSENTPTANTSKLPTGLYWVDKPLPATQSDFEMPPNS